jgi:hypothetical protein
MSLNTAVVPLYDSLPYQYRVPIPSHRPAMASIPSAARTHRDPMGRGGVLWLSGFGHKLHVREVLDSGTDKKAGLRLRPTHAGRLFSHIFARAKNSIAASRLEKSE